MDGRPAGVGGDGTSLRPAVAAWFGAPSAVASDWILGPEDEERQTWLDVVNTQLPPPGQGWKLHVSATAASAYAVLDSVLPVLTGEAATFKVAASLIQLERLNQGHGGAAQVGKFLTVYPVDDAHAVRLARALDHATNGLAGPRIPSDRQLRPGSLVHYRYGGFEGRWMQTPVGEVVPALELPDGTLAPDVRGAMYHQPEWVADPFLAAGVAVLPPPVDLLVGGRYLTVALLNRSARTAVRLALDIETGQRCILKHARRQAAAGPPDDAVTRLRREGEFLRGVAGDPRFPRFLGFLEDASDFFLMTEHCEGQTLEQRVDGLAVEGRSVPVAQAIAWAGELADIVDELHRRGIVYGDLKLSNVLLAPEGTLRLVDFETVSRVDRREATEDDGIIGTLGFLSPQQVVGGTRTPADDIYAFGASLMYLLTGANPSDAPDPLSLLGRPLELLNPAAPPSLRKLVEGCLQSEPTDRPASMADVKRTLASIAPGRPGLRPTLDVTGWAGSAVVQLALQLGRKAGERHYDPMLWRDVHDGVAGIVLTLAEAVAWGASEVDALAAAAQALADSVALPGGPLPGLYVGEAGIGAALLRAGVVLGDDALVDVATAKAELVAGLPHASPDLYSGTAGRIRFHLAVSAVTGSTAQKDAAVAAGERLLASADGWQWTMPVGHGPAGGKRYLGYAHGAAGIADALLDLFEITGDQRFAGAARQTALGLASLARPCLDDGSGRDWDTSQDGRGAGPFWCHGAAGIGKFLFRVGGLGVAPEVGKLALSAAAASARGARWAGPGQCHGLAGNAELLLDVVSASGDPRWTEEASVLVQLLRPFVDGLDDRARLPDSFAGGRAGMAACLLRVEAPADRPHVMNLSALSRTSTHVAQGAHRAPAPVRPASEARQAVAASRR